MKREKRSLSSGAWQALVSVLPRRFRKRRGGFCDPGISVLDAFDLIRLLGGKTEGKRKAK